MVLRKRDCMSAAVCLLMLTLISVLHLYVRMAADDFYYATFCTGGLRGFLSNTVYHYRNVTGRAFVHLLLSPLLMLDMIPFRIWNVLLIGFMTYIMAVISADRGKGVCCLWALALTLFPFMGIAVLGDGALWGAGSFNYLFPTALIILFFLLMMKYTESGRGGWAVVIVAFLSAATVEMTGILAPITVLYVFFAEYKTAKDRIGYFAANFAAACAGYATLFGTCGVAARLSENGYGSIGLFTRAYRNYELFSRMIMDGGGIFVIVAALLAAIGFYCLKRKRIAAFAAFALTALPVLTGTGVIWGSVGIAIAAGVCAFSVFLFGIYTFTAGERVIPFFTLMIFLSLGVCLISPIVGMRMLLPAALFLTVVCLRTLALSFSGENVLRIAGAAAVVPAVAVMVLFITKYASNAGVIDRNTLAAEKYDGSGTLYLQNVPDERYGRSTVPSPGNFGEYFCRLYGISAGIKNYDEETTVMSCDGQRILSPAIRRGGEWYVTVRDVGRLLDAEVSWDYSYAVIDTGDERYRFHLNSRAVQKGNGYGECEKLACPVRMVCETTYISVKDADAIFGLRISPLEQ